MNIQDYTWKTFQDGDKVIARPLLTYATNKIIQYECIGIPSDQTIEGKELELVWQEIRKGKWCDLKAAPRFNKDWCRQILRPKTQPIEDKKETDVRVLQKSLRDLLFIRPYDLHAIESAAVKLCDAVINLDPATIVQKTLEYVAEHAELKSIGGVQEFDVDRDNILSMREDILKEIRK